MKTKILSCLLGAVLCALLAGCGTKEPAPVSEPEPPAPTQDVVLPVSVTEPDAAPEPEETQDVQPEEPVLPEVEGTDDISASYVGTWRNYRMSNGRCAMEIECGDGVNYDIYIHWGSSAASARYWTFTGTYDETQAGIVYTGTQGYGTMLNNDIEWTEETDNEEGLIRLEDGVLYWEDATGYLGEEMDFNRES